MDLKVDYVAKLARIKLSKEEEKKFSKDLANILEHFEELQELDTEKITPLTGGTDLKNSLREDGIKLKESDSEELKNSFPEKENGFLKVPAVFFAEGGSASGGE